MGNNLQIKVYVPVKSFDDFVSFSSIIEEIDINSSYKYPKYVRFSKLPYMGNNLDICELIIPLDIYIKMTIFNGT